MPKWVIRMELVVEANRWKKVWRMSLAEFKQGKWLDQVPDSNFVEIIFKSGHLTIKDLEMKSLDAKYPRWSKGEDENE